MSEELLQRGLNRKTPTSKIGKWDYYNIGATTLKALKSAGIIRNVDYGVLENKKVDALIVNKQNVIAIVEFKQPKEFKTILQQQKAVKQEIEVAKILGSKIVIATDTIDTLWVNALTGELILDEDGNHISVLFDITIETLPLLIEKISYSINETNNQLLSPKLVNPTCLASSIWQDVWSVSGATPENCLYTFVELFIFKYLSDLGILKSRNSFYSLMEMYATDTYDEVLIFYVDNVRKKIKELFPYNPHDNTTIINGSIFVSKDQKAVAGYSTVFFKVLDKFNKYGRLEHIDYDFKSKLFESFLKESISKKNWGQYFTPMKVVRAIEIIVRDEIREGAVICDPACGVGKFLLEPIKSKLDRFYQIEDGKIIPKITIRGFDKGFDKDEQRTIILAKANMLIYFSEIIKNYPNHTKEFADLFNSTFTLKIGSILGTLRDPIENIYDLILTNPPYVTDGSSNLKEEIQKNNDLKKYYKINAKGVEGLFIEWIIRALKPHGKAFVIVPDSIFDNQNGKNLRAFLRQECFIDGIISLPVNTFFTTNKKTYILCITKKNSKTDIQTDSVFTYLVSEIGESRDIYRFDIEQNDLIEATTLYNFFKGNKKAFETINKDPRCKIVSIEKFKSDIHWAVDRWWSKEEKIALGIEKENKTLNVLEFSSVVSGMADTLKAFSTTLQEIKLTTCNKNIAKSKEVRIGDIFDLPSIKGLTKSFIEANKGNIPVYGGKKDEEPIGYIKDNLNNVAYFENCLAWNREGSVGYVFYHKNKFTTNDHHRPMIIKEEYTQILDIEYMRYAIENVLLAQGFKWSKTASKEKVANLLVNIPITLTGEFDIEKQQEIIAVHKKVEDTKKLIQEELKRIQEFSLVI
ncbi:N-6 DNA methylase [Rickettsia endosymbiont of Polydrusus tereticollis]|uniref:N-6 DNA methylase n=1 Tax=Rickettsia endosymbiont of Polydrusus tereticollis TaxID=3066251 RepID=UPI0031332EB2